MKNPVKCGGKEFLGLPTEESVSNLYCVEGWSVKNLKWYGVRFAKIVEIVEPTKDAKHVFFGCSDGYTTDLELEDLLKENVLLAYRLKGELLEVPLDGLLRLVVPDKYAYKSAMWTEQIMFSKKKELGFLEETRVQRYS